jgi:hypothetical protein
MNEPERVYCHSCGNKLDRLILSPKEQEKAAAKKRRIKKMMNPQSREGREWWKTAIKTLFCAAVAAAAVDAARPPEGVPAMPAERFVETKDLGRAVEALTATRGNPVGALSEAEINNYLWNTARVTTDANSWIQKILTFQRVYVELKPDLLKITVQNAIKGHPLYAGVVYRFSDGGNALSATRVSANIGRLRLPHELVPYFSRLLGYINPPWDSLKQENTSINKLQFLQILDGKMILSAARPAAQMGPPPSTAK